MVTIQSIRENVSKRRLKRGWLFLITVIGIVGITISFFLLKDKDVYDIIMSISTSITASGITSLIIFYSYIEEPEPQTSNCPQLSEENFEKYCFEQLTRELSICEYPVYQEKICQNGAMQLLLKMLVEEEAIKELCPAAANKIDAVIVLFKGEWRRTIASYKASGKEEKNKIWPISSGVVGKLLLPKNEKKDYEKYTSVLACKKGKKPNGKGSNIYVYELSNRTDSSLRSETAKWENLEMSGSETEALLAVPLFSTAHDLEKTIIGALTLDFSADIKRDEKIIKKSIEKTIRYSKIIREMLGSYQKNEYNKLVFENWEQKGTK